ncbi:endoplasmic reticulum junction formation protein lunapark-B-like isoform X4 [Branchiostoma floridae]|uniref:Endoplasmic reticulum junction formation protein lunapark n=1 Tax=Branchiostoma floridae TaxID=7739 RepID=A0A9J7HFT7_BRAFL|nr:endoplasmic reticulum junction formation protein lunapark-B-like isoform X4 [Branchiostoma floridae]
MGAVLARFKKKQTTVEVLEGLDKEIQSLEQFKRHNEELQRRYVGGLLIYSIVLYIAAAVMFYFLFFPEGWEERVLRSLPLLMFPLLIWTVKKLLHWYFVRRITKKESQLEDLREKKKGILEDVMEHETYKAAKEILERFGPSKEEATPETPPGSPRRQPGPPVPTPLPPGQELRQRRTPAPPAQPNIPRLAVAPTRVETPPQGTPAPPRPPGNLVPATPSIGRPPGPPLARPILPRERTVFDRVVDYLVGEGPSSRFALICQQCHSHNGMALQEEFEFITFRCAYCYTLNPARKVRPTAPKLLPDEPRTHSSTSGEDVYSGEEQKFVLHDKESDSEAKFADGKDDENDCDRDEMVREEEEMIDTVAAGNKDMIPEEEKAVGDNAVGKAVEDVASEIQEDIGQGHVKDD